MICTSIGMGLPQRVGSGNSGTAPLRTCFRGVVPLQQTAANSESEKCVRHGLGESYAENHMISSSSSCSNGFKCSFLVALSQLSALRFGSYFSYCMADLGQKAQAISIQLRQGHLVEDFCGILWTFTWEERIRLRSCNGSWSKSWAPGKSFR